MMFRFPDGFLWGAASSACQIEAACEAGNKRPTVFDYYSRTLPDRFSNEFPDFDKLLSKTDGNSSC